MLALEPLLQDLRFALRQIRRAPAFALTAALTLALGIGANAAIFGIINGFLRPLPVSDPDRIVVLAATLPGDDTGIRYRFSYPAIQDYRRLTDIFSDVFAFDVRIGGLGAEGRTTQFVYHTVTGDFFSALGLAPSAGRLFLPGEGEHANAEPVIVLGHAYWQRRFGSNPSVVGASVRLDGRSARVIGIAPEGFRGLFEGADMDGYVPLGAVQSKSIVSGLFFSDRSIRGLTMVARLRPGMTIARAQSAVDVLAGSLATAYPATEKGTGTRVIPERGARPMPLPFLANVLPFVRVLLLVLAALVLLIACMNVANLLLVRATVREREMAVRAALGAGRHRLIRLLLVESAILAIAGAALGIVIGQWVSVTFARSIRVGTDVPLFLDFHFDWPVFVYAFAATAVTAIVVGVLPAMRASRARVTDLLHDGGRGSSGGGRQRVRSLLVVMQVAGSLVLLVVAGLFVRNLQRAQHVDLGFDPGHVLTVRIDPQNLGYDTARAWTFYDELERRLRDVPGVESVSMSSTVPLGYISGGYVARAEGAAAAADGPGSAIGCNTISPTYFETLRIPLVEGRAFTEHDVEHSPRVAIVNQTMAARLWPGQTALGKKLEIPALAGPAWEVVGVVRDSKYLAVFETPLPHFYLPQGQNFTFLRSLEVRSATPLRALAMRVQREVEALEPDMPVADVRPLTETITGNFGFLLFRVGAMQASAMSVLGLVLAVIGVYGVVSYRTTQRRREIGIRMALGAEPNDVRGLVLRQGVALVAIGIAAGLVVATGATTILTRIMVFVSVTDPATFLLVTAFLTAAAVAACYVPARRAMRADPAVALRQE
jgi:macrolide transport system ATP-binding/permease protein